MRFDFKWEALQRGIWTCFGQKRKSVRFPAKLYTIIHAHSFSKYTYWEYTYSDPYPRYSSSKVGVRLDWGGLNRGSVTDLWARVSAVHWSRAGEAQHNRWITNARTGAPPLHTNVPKQWERHTHTHRQIRVREADRESSILTRRERKRASNRLTVQVRFRNTHSCLCLPWFRELFISPFCKSIYCFLKQCQFKRDACQLDVALWIFNLKPN